MKGDGNVAYEEVNKDYVKLYNMFSLHGVMVCSVRGMLILQKCFLEGYYKDYNIG